MERVQRKKRYVNIISHSLFFFKLGWGSLQFPVLKQNKAGKRKGFSMFQPDEINEKKATSSISYKISFEGQALNKDRKKQFKRSRG